MFHVRCSAHLLLSSVHIVVSFRGILVSCVFMLEWVIPYFVCGCSMLVFADVTSICGILVLLSLSLSVLLEFGINKNC